jgi:hypothetical protein
MNYTKLYQWLSATPSSGWPTSSDAEIAAWCNEIFDTIDRTHLPTRQIWSVILANRDEWAQLTEGEQAIVTSTLAFNEAEGVPTDANAVERQTLVAILKANTKQALAAEIPKSITRVAAQNEVGAQTVSEADISFIRRYESD